MAGARRAGTAMSLFVDTSAWYSLAVTSHPDHHVPQEVPAAVGILAFLKRKGEHIRRARYTAIPRVQLGDGVNLNDTDLNTLLVAWA